MHTLRLTLIASLATASFAAARQSSTFTPIPLDVPGYLSPRGVSADGSSVVGMAYLVSSGDRARRWRAGIGFDYPGPSVNPNIASWCSGISSDGATIIGGNGHAVFGDLEGWIRYAYNVGHIGSPAGHDTSDTLAVSLDGHKTAGYGGHQSNPNVFEAAIYDEFQGWKNLGFLAGGNDSQATAINGDGSVVAGWSNDAALTNALAWRWTPNGGMVSLGFLAGGGTTRPTGMNAAGTVIVGYDEAHSNEAWRWTASTGIVALGHLPGGSDSAARAVSADGALIVGEATDSTGSPRAFIWDGAHGMRDLRSVLIAQGVAQLAQWDLSYAKCIAGDGPYWIAGEGGTPSGASSAWLVRFDEGGPAGTLTLCSGDSSAACPCGNFGASGEGCRNSTGQGASLGASGSVSVASDDLALLAVHVPTQRSGLVFMGVNAVGGGHGIAFDDGLLCTSGSLFRFAVQNSGSSGALKQLQPVANSSNAIVAGSSWIFQAWYRDPSGPCASGANLSNALRAVFVP